MAHSFARRRRALMAAGLAGGLTLASFGFSAAPAAAEDSSYTVRPGDTLWGIAARLGVPVRAIAEANGITDHDVVIAGTRLDIPAGTDGASGGSSADDEAANSPSRDITKAKYKVKAGDTWSRIASRYSMGAEQLADANDADTDEVLYVGQEITIPALAASGPSGGSGGGSSYTVVAGDTLGRIASRHGTTANALAEANELELDDFLQIGQRLTVPGSSGGGASLPVDVDDDDIPSQLPSKIRNDPERLALLPVFRSAASEYGIPDDLLMSVCYLESGWTSGVISYLGAMGLCQLMPDTAADLAAWMGEPDLDPWIPIDNVRMSAKYLGILLAMNGGDSDAALAAYYQGQVSVEQNGMYTDTERYVEIVQNNRERFQ